MSQLASIFKKKISHIRMFLSSINFCFHVIYGWEFGKRDWRGFSDGNQSIHSIRQVPQEIHTAGRRSRGGAPHSIKGATWKGTFPRCSQWAGALASGPWQLPSRQSFTLVLGWSRKIRTWTPLLISSSKQKTSFHLSLQKPPNNNCPLSSGELYLSQDACGDRGRRAPILFPRSGRGSPGSYKVHTPILQGSASCLQLSLQMKMGRSHSWSSALWAKVGSSKSCIRPFQNPGWVVV